MTDTAPPRRPHTGRRRNDAAREAILDAAMRLLTNRGDEPLTVDTLAREAGVGKQTIYRWWSTKGEVLLEAMDRYARLEVPTPDTGSLREDLEQFLAATFRGAAEPATSAMLRALAGESATNPHVADLLRGFTETRRVTLRALLERGLARGELAPGVDLDLIVDQVYGVLWYRLLLGHRPLTADAATHLASALLKGYSE
jgi:AcrR family transcriptional regulator